MSANLTEVTTSRDTPLDAVTFREVRNQLEARMISLGLNPDDDGAWDNTVGELGVDQIVMTVCDTQEGACFLRSLEELTMVQMSKVEGVLPGIIDLSQTNKPDVVMVLVEMERLYKVLQERMEILESNRGQLRMKLGEIMRDNGEAEFKAVDSIGRVVANIKLDLKYRPSWAEKEMQFEFFDKIGQGDIIQPSVPWQTAEKVVNCFVDEADEVVRLSEEPTVDVFISLRNELARKLNIKAEGIKFVVVQTTDRGSRVLEYTGDTEFPFRPLCSLFQTVTAKITKLY